MLLLVLLLAVIGVIWRGFPILSPFLVGLYFFIKTVNRVTLAGDEIVLEKGIRTYRLHVDDLVAVRFSMTASGVELHTKHGDFDVALGRRTKGFLQDLRTCAPHVQISGFRGLYY